MADGHKILDGLDDIIAWTEGDDSAARVVRWEAPTSIDVRSVRSKLGMSQRQFAARFGLKLDTLRNWEQSKRVPDGTARVLLTLIDRDPEGVKRALAI